MQHSDIQIMLEGIKGIPLDSRQGLERITVFMDFHKVGRNQQHELYFQKESFHDNQWNRRN